MRRISRPLARELLLLVMASAAPGAAVAASLAASAYDPGWRNALLLVVSATALAAGAYVSCLIARGLRKSLEDIAADARMLSRGAPLAQLGMKLGELAAIADALEAASARLREPAPTPAPASAPMRPDLARGAQSWSNALEARYRASEARPPIEKSADWCDLDTVLTRLAKRFAAPAAAAGIARGFDVAPRLYAVRGMAQDLETALGGLLDSALTVTSRGGLVTLAAREVAAGTVKIVLETSGPMASEARGMEAAGNMIELSCGATLAASLAQARTLIERSGGALESGANAVTIFLVSTLSSKKAA